MKPKVIVSAIVYRADGTIEDLGVLKKTPWWRKMLNKLKKQ